MIAVAITSAITLVLLAALISGSRTSKATAKAIVVATETAFTREAIPQAARDAALLFLKERSK